MTNKDFERYIKSPEFKEILQRYEDFWDSGDSVYFEVDDLLDIAEYYHYVRNFNEAERCMQYCLTQYPDEQQALLFLARMYLIDFDDIKAAKECIGKINDSSNIEAFLIKAELLLLDGSEEKANEVLLKKYNKEKARIDYQNGENDDTIAFTEEDDEDEFDLEFLYNFPLEAAGMFIDRDQHEFAEQWLERLPENTSPNDLDVLDIKARILMARDELEDAIVIWNKILDNDAYNITAWLKLCDSQYKLERYEEALQSAQYAHDVAPKEPEPYLAMGNCYFSMGKAKEAKEMFDTYLSKVPDDIFAQFLLGMLNYGSGELEVAFETFIAIEDSVEMIPEINLDTYFLTYYSVSILLKRYDDSERIINHYEQLGGKSCDIKTFRGQLEFEKGNFEMGISYLTEAIKDDSINLETTINIASILYKNEIYIVTYNLYKIILERYEQMEIPFLESMITPFLAATCQKLGKKEECMEYLEKAIRDNPDMTKYLFANQFPPETPVEDYPKLIVIEENDSEYDDFND